MTISLYIIDCAEILCIYICLVVSCWFVASSCSLEDIKDYFCLLRNSNVSAMLPFRRPLISHCSVPVWSLEPRGAIKCWFILLSCSSAQHRAWREVNDVPTQLFKPLFEQCFKCGREHKECVPFACLVHFGSKPQWWIWSPFLSLPKIGFSCLFYFLSWWSTIIFDVSSFSQYCFYVFCHPLVGNGSVILWWCSFQTPPPPFVALIF